MSFCSMCVKIRQLSQITPKACATHILKHYYTNYKVKNDYPSVYWTNPNIRRCFAMNQRPCPPSEKPKIVERSLKLLKKYWKIALPVHIINSVGFYTICYYATTHGFDILKILKKAKVKEEFIDFLTGSDQALLGAQLTIIFALYKLLAPLRYLVTIVVVKLISRYGKQLKRKLMN